MSEKITPMMQQWHTCKAKAKNALVLFRLGDFYEAFYEDAKILSNDLDLTLTQRQGIPMSGIPASSLEGYLSKLIGKGHLIAIAEQMEDPRDVKGIVKREIVSILSPAAILNPSYISEKTHNFFASICQLNSRFALALIDISTSDFKVVECDHLDEIKEALLIHQPSEILLSQKFHQEHLSFIQAVQQTLTIRLTVKADYHFHHQGCFDGLVKHFQVHHLDGMGLKGQIAAINAAGAVLQHLQEELGLNLKHIQSIESYHFGHFMHIDPTTLRHLEILFPAQSGEKTPTLHQFMDHTSTPMGARLFREWILQPLIDIKAIQRRLDAVELLSRNSSLASLFEHLSKIKDIERLMTRIGSTYLGPRDFLGLKLSLIPLEPIKQLLTALDHEYLNTLRDKLTDFSSLIHELSQTLVNEPPLRTSDGNFIKDGISKELDHLRTLKKNSHAFLLNYQETLRQETGIKTLRVHYNKAFGYYIEVSRGQSPHMPTTFYKKQTLVNCERFISEELKEFEHQILHAEEKISQIEMQLFHKLKETILIHELSILQTSKAIAEIDSLISLALLAKKKGYTKPTLDNSRQIMIEGGRHPIIESSMTHQSFIPNDLFIGASDAQLILLTGPNMAGKSTYIRQVALITIMAQIGSFVPADKAHIGIVDKVYSRIGAHDDLSRGQSTFMVEMSETANILNHVTDHSLIILDEIGRGTSTYDGISIAWAVVEYLLTQEGKKAKTLFATHYSELIELENKFSGIKNFHVAVEESSHGIVFLRKIIPGGTDKSYGIHVAKLAGLPSITIQRAYEILSDLESHKGIEKKKVKRKIEEDSFQLSFFSNEKSSSFDPVIQAIKALDLHQTTPLAALLLIEEWKRTLQT